MSETVSPSVNRAYGLARVCRVWRVARSTIHHQRNLPAHRQACRPGPIGAASDTLPAMLGEATFEGAMLRDHVIGLGYRWVTDHGRGRRP